MLAQNLHPAQRRNSSWRRRSQPWQSAWASATESRPLKRHASVKSSLRSIQVPQRLRMPPDASVRNRSTISAIGTRRTKPGAVRLLRRKRSRSIPIDRCRHRERLRVRSAGSRTAQPDSRGTPGSRGDAFGDRRHPPVVLVVEQEPSGDRKHTISVSARARGNEHRYGVARQDTGAVA